MLTGKAEGDIPKADRDFNIALQDLFGTRLLQAQDYERVYKIMEEMGFGAGGRADAGQALHRAQRQGHGR